MARYILNSAVITSPGEYSYRLISVDEARGWLAREEGYISTIGYEQTSAALERLTGHRVPVNRVTIEMQPGDEALVFRLKFPPGTPRIDPQDKGKLEEHLLAGHYELGLLRKL